jgi:hypothetical protein
VGYPHLAKADDRQPNCHAHVPSEESCTDALRLVGGQERRGRSPAMKLSKSGGGAVEDLAHRLCDADRG